MDISSPTAHEPPEIALNRMLATIEGMSIATAESCTGGNVAARISSVPGSSSYFLGGVVAYDNGVKERVLGVPFSVLEQFGAVSAECAQAMAEGARSLIDAEVAVSTTGVAGPSGGSASKPVGLVYIGIAGRRNIETFRYQFHGNRHEVVAQATEHALRELRQFIEAEFAHIESQQVRSTS